MFKIDMIRNKLGNLYFIYENFLISVVKLTVSLLHSDKLCYIFFYGVSISGSSAA